jgi:putative ABC transport system permease protein
VTGLIGAVVEAWDELRIHRLRVLLALIGVAVAVASITGVTAAVQMLTQSFHEQNDRAMGRQVTLQLNAWAQTPDAAGSAGIEADLATALERYGIDYSSRVLGTAVPMRLPSGATQVSTQAVDPDLALINRITTIEGRWFTEDDAGSYAPQLVVNEAFLRALGLSDLSSHPTVRIGDVTPVRAQVIGVTAASRPAQEPSALVQYAQRTRRRTAEPGYGQQVPTFMAWVPADQADALGERIVRDVGAGAEGWTVEVYDNREMGGGSIDGAAKWIGIGIGGFALLLGGLGLVNISLVTVRYRIREIGIRRSFGATSARIFFGVLMESVVATVVAGAVGVTLAVVAIRAVPVERLFGSGIQDMPPFPVSAALIGLASAAAVGTLAGVIPATVAVRIKVIDAIRY